MIVHSNNTNPWLHRVVFLQEKGLRDDDIVKSSGRLIKQKVCECSEEAIEWPVTRTINLATQSMTVTWTL